MRLLIVVDKLLTGFDAASCTYLYIYRRMYDHGLFKAICRVNRLDGEEKPFGYIVDYIQLLGDLADALQKYTAGAFEGYDEADVDGLIKNRLTEARHDLGETLEQLWALCEGVREPKTELDFLHYFCGESGVDLGEDEAYARSRERLYQLAGHLLRAYGELKGDMTSAAAMCLVRQHGGRRGTGGQTASGNPA